VNEFIRIENGTGILNINGKKQETPCFFPTLMFSSEKLRKIDDICQDLLSHICKARLVNFVDIKLNTNFKVKKHILTFVDSGGFRLKEEGAKILPSKLKIMWNCQKIGILDVLKTQNEKGDMGNTLDFPIQSNLRNKDEYVFFNLKCAMQSLKLKPDGLFLYGTIQAWDCESAIEYTRKIARLPFDGFAIGGLVQFSNNPQKIIDIVAAVRLIVPKEKPVHVFGVANIDLIPILLKLGVDTFDSSSYIRMSLDRNYLMLCNKKLSLTTKVTYSNLPCFCPICQNNHTELFLQNTIRSYALLALHNLHQIESFIRYCRIQMVEGNLDELVWESIQKLGSKIDRNKISLYIKKASDEKD
jgi:tRNA-guanine family transglycosylase